MRLSIGLLALVACGGASRSVPTGSGGSTATGSGKPLATPKRSADIHVVITERRIAINGVVVGGKPKVADMLAIFGKPDRTWDTGGANLVHTWDTLGLVVYEPYDESGEKGDGRCISTTFPYKPMSNTFTPNKLFAGTIQIDGKSFDPTVTLANVLRWPGATQPYTKQSIVFDRGDFHVFTIQEKERTTIDLVELSFWQNAREEQLASRTSGVDDDACKPGDPQACSNLALGYFTGANGRKSVERAFELFKIACDGGDMFGCLVLGNMHDAGRGTAQSKPEAKVAWKRSCTLGYKPACELAK